MSSNEDKAQGRPRGDESADMSVYWRQVRPYVWLVGLVAVAGVALAYAVTSRLPRIYEASCSLEYDPNPARPLGEEVEDPVDPGGSYWSSHEFYETQNRIIASRLLAERVVRQLGLHQDRTFPSLSHDEPESWQGISVEQAAILLQERVTVAPVPETRIVQVRVRDRYPERAATIANAIVDAYIQKTIEDRLGSTVSALEWLSEQLDNLRGELNESELALHNFWEDHDILSVSMEDRQNLVAHQLEQFSTALTAAQTRRIELRARVARLRALASAPSVDDIGAGFEDYEAIQTLQATLRTSLAERESLSARYGVEHPRIQEIDRRIESTRQALRDEIAAVLRAAEGELREAGEIEGGLQHAVQEANAAGLQLNLLEIEYSRLNRERENQAHLYQLVLERTTETDLTRMLRTTHVRTVDRALAPSVPVSPRLPINLAAGAGGGLVLGFALALLLARLDRRIRTVRQAEEVGLTILGVVPEMDEAAIAAAAKAKGAATPQPSRRRRRAGREQPAGSVHRDLIAHTHPMSAAAENLRAIRTNLMFMSGDRPIRSLAVTSGSPREGKTTLAVNLAISVAQSGKRVLIVDTDMRRPRLHHAFGIDSKTGLTNVLVGNSTPKDVIRSSVVPSLSVLPCGPIPPNPSELLHRERFQQFVKEATEMFDFVVFDSPPLGPVTDAAVLGTQVDGVLIVVKSQQTTTDALSSVLRQLNDVAANVVGGVINGFDPKHSRYDGGYYYYYRREGYYYSSDEQVPRLPSRDDDDDSDDDDPRPGSAVN
jgi:capsular exopolysaccharide synthesis family protein